MLTSDTGPRGPTVIQDFPPSTSVAIADLDVVLLVNACRHLRFDPLHFLGMLALKQSASPTGGLSEPPLHT